MSDSPSSNCTDCSFPHVVAGKRQAVAWKLVSISVMLIRSSSSCMTLKLTYSIAVLSLLYLLS